MIHPMTLPALALDHLVVAARDLESGARWCLETLGCAPTPGGRHPLMGTHNSLLRLSGEGESACYLEILAIDPQAPAPARRRWFGFDEPEFASSIAAGPRLLHWVARTIRLDRVLDAWALLGHDAGPALAAARETPRGRLEWRIAVRDDGRLAAGGAWPTLIEWRGAHPVDDLPDVDLRLESLQLAPTAARGAGLDAALAAAGGMAASGPGVSVSASALRGGGAPALAATLRAPRGRLTIDSAGRTGHHACP